MMTSAAIHAPLPSAVFANAYDPDAPEALWAIGFAPSVDGPVEFALSNRDVQADAKWGARQLDALGVGRGALIDLIHDFREFGQFWPWYVAAGHLGAQVMNGMATPWDVGRMEMYIRRFNLHAVAGVGRPTLDGLASFGFDAVRIFADLPVLVARDDAVDTLRALGLAPHILTILGPILLLQAPGEAGAPYDTAEWRVEADPDSHLRVTAASSRACGFQGLDSGLCGHVADGRVFVDRTT